MPQKKSKDNGHLKFIDLFAGIGGFRLALEMFGEECVFSSDFDKNSQIVYRYNFKETPKGDITKIKLKKSRLMMFCVPVFLASLSAFRENKKGLTTLTTEIYF